MSEYNIYALQTDALRGIRLFEVKRLENGHTKTRRIKVKPDKFVEQYNPETVDLQRFKLSELWTRGFLGAISDRF